MAKHSSLSDYFVRDEEKSAMALSKESEVLVLDKLYQTGGTFEGMARSLSWIGARCSTKIGSDTLHTNNFLVYLAPSLMMVAPNKLECLSLGSFFMLVYCW
jgi:hypothetical protein